MEREQIGVFRIIEDQKRVKHAQCPKHDEWRVVKPGDYPVLLAKESHHASRVYASRVLVVFDSDFCEDWYGFMMGQQENFIPAVGWEVHRYQFQSCAADGHMIDTADIVRVG